MYTNLKDNWEKEASWVWKNKATAYLKSYPNLGFIGAEVDMVHAWSIFTMYWPTIGFCALIGKE